MAPRSVDLPALKRMDGSREDGRLVLFPDLYPAVTRRSFLETAGGGDDDL